MTNSASSTPGQFVFSLDKAALQVLVLTPGQVLGGVYSSLYGVDAGSVSGERDDHDIRVVYDQFQDRVTPQQVDSVVIQTPRGPVAVRDVMSYELRDAVTSYQRENGNIIIKVGADLEQGIASSGPQGQLISYAKAYDFPDGISYQSGGDTSENVELLTAMGTGAMISFLLIYAILVLQFNSYRQPAFILYTVLVALLGSNI